MHLGYYFLSIHSAEEYAISYEILFHMKFYLIDKI